MASIIGIDEDWPGQAWDVTGFNVPIEEGWNVENITVRGNTVRVNGWGFQRLVNGGRLVCMIEGGEMQRLSHAQVESGEFLTCAMPFYS